MIRTYVFKAEVNNKFNVIVKANRYLEAVEEANKFIKNNYKKIIFDNKETEMKYDCNLIEDYDDSTKLKVDVCEDVYVSFLDWNNNEEIERFRWVRWYRPTLDDWVGNSTLNAPKNEFCIPMEKLFEQNAFKDSFIEEELGYKYYNQRDFYDIAFSIALTITNENEINDYRKKHTTLCAIPSYKDGKYGGYYDMIKQAIREIAKLSDSNDILGTMEVYPALESALSNSEELNFSCNDSILDLLRKEDSETYLKNDKFVWEVWKIITEGKGCFVNLAPDTEWYLIKDNE